MSAISTASLPACHRWTAEQLERLPSGQRCELIEGVLVLMSPAGPSHGYQGGNFWRLIAVHVHRHRLGRTYLAETGFLIGRDPDTVRAPDVAFVRSERVVEVEQGFFPGPPDLAVEIVSPGESKVAVMEKVEMWLDRGTRRVWVGWPRTRTVTQHDPGEPVRVFHEGDRLEGGDVLPGFSCEVSEIFE